jgi:hypothetical protein
MDQQLPTMAGGNPQDQIANLEEQIERLADMAERCRKFIFAAKVSILVGAAWLVAALFGVLPGAGSIIGATAALVGGIVTFGTNTATLRQLAESLAATEQMRARLIGRMELRVIENRDWSTH